MTNLQPTPHDSRKNDQLTITAKHVSVWQQ